MKSKIKSTINGVLSKLGVRARIVSGHDYLTIRRQEYIRDFSLDIFPFLLFALSLLNEEIKFIQIGANDGVTDDKFGNYIDDYKLTGVLCEPQEGAFAKLRSLHKENSRIFCENVAVSASGIPLKFFRFDRPYEAGHNLSVFASTDQDHLLKWKKRWKLEANIKKRMLSQ